MRKEHTYKGVVIALAVLFAAAVLYARFHTSAPVGTVGQTNIKDVPISITSKKIQEKNFTGSEPVIAGSGALAAAAQAYVDVTVAQFKESADSEVPDLRAKFGADSPSANYTIDIGANYVTSGKTESIVMDEYAYTGGANGNSTYKVITTEKSTGKILSLGDIMGTDKQAEFTAMVRQALKDWRPEGSEESVVWADQVDALTIDSFANWSLDNKNLVIYFDKYAIAAGAMGAIDFPFPIQKVKKFLNPDFI